MGDILEYLKGGGKRRKSQKKGGNLLENIKEKMKGLTISGGKKGGEGLPQSMKDYITQKATEYLKTTGGKKPLTKKGEYIQKLNKHSLIKIQNYAKSLGLEIKKRYNGKIINITKKNLIKKIANLRFK